MCNFRSTLVYHPPNNSASTLSLQTTTILHFPETGPNSKLQTAQELEEKKQ